MNTESLNIKTVLILFLPLLYCCKGKTADSETPNFNYPDTLRVGTLYSPSSYFEYRDQPMGYDYSLAQQLGDDKGIEIEIVVAPSVATMIEMLDSGYIDLAAYDVPVTGETLGKIIPCGYEHLTSQILVQKKGPNRISDVTKLIGNDVYVERDSRFYHRLENLDEELGGGINIRIIEEDSLISEDLLEKVNDGTIPFTVVDSEVARLNKSYFPDLDMTVELSFPQRSSWAVAKNKAWLGDSVTAWFKQIEPLDQNQRLLRRYFELTRTNKLDIRAFGTNFSKGYISEYDSLFKQYSELMGWDWRLFAAMAYAESRFDNSVVSWAGAKGIMQVMPRTARAFGVSEENIIVPSENVKLATKIMQSLDKSLKRYVSDDIERQKFVLAAYNSGLAHILDAINIARAKGYNPQIWSGNVAEALKMKSSPEIYNDPELCRYGYFKGTYTVAYVKSVMELYQKALSGLKNP